MAQIETWYRQDLKQPVQVHHLPGNVFSQDNQGNLLGVEVFDDGVPASLSGTVSANIVRSDGGTVGATGTLSGNKLSVVLPAAAYAIPGVISVVVKLSNGSASAVTLLAVVAIVYASSTATPVDPGTVLPDISALIASINNAIASIPPDYDAMARDVKAINDEINGRVFNYSVNSLSGWNEQIIVPDMALSKDDYVTIEADFTPAVDSSTYIYLKNGDTEISYSQVNGLSSKVITHKATADLSQFRVTTNSQSYTGKINVKLTVSSRQTQVEENRITAHELAAETPGYFALQRLSPFIRGGYDYPDYNYNTYQISSKNVMTAPFPIYMRVKSGFHAKVLTINNGVASDSGWQTNSLYVPKDTQFVVKIERVSPDTSEVADIDLFLSKVVVFSDYILPWQDVKKFADDVIAGATINYETGALQSAGSYYLIYAFKNPEFRFVKLHASTYDRNIAEIAFYSSEEINTNNYLGSASANQGAWVEDNWSYAEVPDNCKLVCFGSRNVFGNDTPHDIQIFADNCAKYDQETVFYKQPPLSLFKDFKYCYHFNANRLGTAEIPLNSILDIDIAHRLGFKCYEINARETATPGYYVCMHGNGGKIGTELIARDGTDISNIQINTVTQQTFEEDYIYNTSLPELRTKVTSLDEAINLCRKYGMFPMISWCGYQGIKDIPKYAGNDFVVIIYDQYYIGRTAFKGALVLYKTLTDADFASLLGSVEKPFIFNLTADEVSSMTKAQKLARIEACHKNNCIIGAAGVYQSAADNIELFELGVDYLASGWEVEDFSEGNLVSLQSGETFDGFTHDGTVTGGVLALANGGSMSVTPSSGASLFLSKGSLKIRFAGSLKFNMGEYITDEVITSDGSHDIILTTAFYKANPAFSVEAVGAVSVYGCVYDVSVC